MIVNLCDYSDGVFGFMETFEERSLKLKVSQHKDKERKLKLQSDLNKVLVYLIHYSYIIIS